VAHRDEFIGQPVNHPLGAASALRRHGFEQRGDLGDTHGRQDLLAWPGKSRGNVAETPACRHKDRTFCQNWAALLA
jgi:hypothetical protein